MKKIFLLLVLSGGLFSPTMVHTAAAGDGNDDGQKAPTGNPLLDAIRAKKLKKVDKSAPNIANVGNDSASSGGAASPSSATNAPTSAGSQQGAFNPGIANILAGKSNLKKIAPKLPPSSAPAAPDSGSTFGVSLNPTGAGSAAASNAAPVTTKAKPPLPTPTKLTSKPPIAPKPVNPPSLSAAPLSPAVNPTSATPSPKKQWTPPTAAADSATARQGLLGAIHAGTTLKKTTTKDTSGPKITSDAQGSATSVNWNMNLLNPTAGSTSTDDGASTEFDDAGATVAAAPETVSDNTQALTEIRQMTEQERKQRISELKAELAPLENQYKDLNSREKEATAAYKEDLTSMAEEKKSNGFPSAQTEKEREARRQELNNIRAQLNDLRKKMAPLEKKHNLYTQVANEIRDQQDALLLNSIFQFFKAEREQLFNDWQRLKEGTDEIAKHLAKQKYDFIKDFQNKKYQSNNSHSFNERTLIEYHGTKPAATKAEKDAWNTVKNARISGLPSDAAVGKKMEVLRKLNSSDSDDENGDDQDDWDEDDTAPLPATPAPTKPTIGKLNPALQTAIASGLKNDFASSSSSATPGKLDPAKASTLAAFFGAGGPKKMPSAAASPLPNSAQIQAFVNDVFPPLMTLAGYDESTFRALIYGYDQELYFRDILSAAKLRTDSDSILLLQEALALELDNQLRTYGNLSGARKATANQAIQQDRANAQAAGRAAASDADVLINYIKTSILNPGLLKDYETAGDLIPVLQAEIAEGLTDGRYEAGFNPSEAELLAYVAQAQHS